MLAAQLRCSEYRLVGMGARNRSVIAAKTQISMCSPNLGERI